MAEEKTAITTPKEEEKKEEVATTGKEEVVTLTKEEHDTLVKKAEEVETAKNLQAQADKKTARLEKILKGNKLSFTKKSTEVASKEEPNSEVGSNEQDILEDRKAESGLISIAIDPKYREILDNDPTLRDLFTKNPLAVLPILAPEALDAEDAIELVKDKLDEKLISIKSKKEEIITSEKKEDKPTPPEGGLNVASEEVDVKYEEAKKNPNTESALAGMIKVGLSNLKK